MKIVKRLALAVLALLVLAVGGVAGRFFVLAPSSRPATAVKAPATPEAIARGQYLANSVMLCMSCHSEGDEAQPGQPMTPGMLGSGRVFPMKGFPGRIRSHNLTPDPKAGLGEWTDGEILRAMREGIGRDGHPLFPMMPYATMAKALGDDDALAIIAYLRTLPPIATNHGPTELDFPISMLVRAGPKPVEHPAPPMPTEPLARGQWLITVANCHSCHDSHDDRHEVIAGQEFAGGDPFPMPDGSTIRAANISSDAATGIGAYSDEDLERVLTEGKNKAGRSLLFMPFTWYRNMTADDRKALILALRTAKPVSHLVVADPERQAAK